jgi:hypothetical protein
VRHRVARPWRYAFRAEGVPPRDLPHWGAGSIVVVFFAFPGFAALVDGQGSDAER